MLASTTVWRGPNGGDTIKVHRDQGEDVLFTPWATVVTRPAPLRAFGIVGPPIPTSSGVGVPKIRFAVGPAIEDLGPILEHLVDLHARSASAGWRLVYWTIEAVGSYVKSCGAPEAQAFAAINPLYPNVQVDFFKLILMRDFGGLWLDLRADVSVSGRDASSGLDALFVGPGALQSPVGL